MTEFEPVAAPEPEAFDKVVITSDSQQTVFEVGAIHDRADGRVARLDKTYCGYPCFMYVPVGDLMVKEKGSAPKP